jgi:serine protease AprX
VVVVASAGNYGKVNVDGQDLPVYGGIASPGSLPDVITVGAPNTNKTVARGDDVVATYSSRGPRACWWPVREASMRPARCGWR